MTFAHIEDAETFLYVLESGGRVKIGIAKDVEERRINLEFGCPFPVATICQRRFSSRTLARRAERFLHSKFDDCRTHGEWFQMSPEDAAKAVNDVDESAPEVAITGKLRSRRLSPMPAPKVLSVAAVPKPSARPDAERPSWDDYEAMSDEEWCDWMRGNTAVLQFGRTREECLAEAAEYDRQAIAKWGHKYGIGLPA